MTKPRQRSKRELASDHVEQALSHASQALSKLGGRTRFRSSKVPADSLYIARQYLEGIINRLAVVEQLMALNAPVRVVNMADPPINRTLEVTVLDDFEHTYDSTRRPEC